VDMQTSEDNLKRNTSDPMSSNYEGTLGTKHEPTTAEAVRSKVSEAASAVSKKTADIADGVAEAATSASQSAKKTARKAVDKTKAGAKVTAEAVRENPGTTAAFIGGIATAAIAAVVGVKMYQDNQKKRPSRTTASNGQRKSAPASRKS
jgi:cobalamin biosynthesis Mg chelatase CobN